MSVRKKHYLWGATAGWLVATSVSAYVAPERDQDAKMMPFTIEQRVLRPLTYADDSALYDKDASEKVSLRRDKLSKSVRLMSGIFDVHPLSVDDPKEAFIDAALSYVDAHPEVFGITSQDLTVVADSTYLDKDVQFIRFAVHRDGLHIADATIDFRFKLGHLVQVLNQSYSEAKVRRGADLAGLAERVTAQTGMTIQGEETAFYRVEATEKGYELVKVISYELTNDDDNSFSAQIEATTGKLFEVKDNHYHYASISVKSDVHKRWYNEPLESQPLRNIEVTTDAGPVFPDDSDGEFAQLLENPPRVVGLSGRFAKVKTLSGTLVTKTAELVNGNWLINIQKVGSDPAWVDQSIAQAMVYYHTNAINERAKQYIQNDWLNKPLTANANLPRSCNAHWDGSTINLYSSSSSCANTGLIADVIYHEWGHGLDAKTGGIEDGAFSEGYGDILSLVMTHSNQLGIGFRLPNYTPVRDLEPDRIYPRDRGEVHAEGLIIGSTFWDLFKALKAKYGETKAGTLIETYAFKMILTARTYLDVYNTLLVIDDNDSNPRNGTPNLCLINQAFRAHGLADENVSCRMASVDEYEIDDSAGDDDGVIEPGESIDMFITARNGSASDLDGLKGKLSIASGAGVTLKQASLSWATIPVGGQVRSNEAAKLSIASNAVCGSTFVTNLTLAAGDQTAVLTRSFQIGKNGGTKEFLTGTGMPVRIPDLQTASVSVQAASGQWGAETKVAAAYLQFDISHSYVGDLRVSLKAPSGKVFEIIRGSGSGKRLTYGADISTIVASEKGRGTWTLIVTDTAQRDEGQIESFVLSLTPATFVCD